MTTERRRSFQRGVPEIDGVLAQYTRAKLSEREAKSQLEYLCREILLAVRDVFGIIAITSLFLIPVIFLIWIAFQLTRPLIEFAF